MDKLEALLKPDDSKNWRLEERLANILPGPRFEWPDNIPYFANVQIAMSDDPIFTMEDILAAEKRDEVEQLAHFLSKGELHLRVSLRSDRDQYSWFGLRPVPLSTFSREELQLLTGISKHDRLPLAMADVLRGGKNMDWVDLTSRIFEHGRRLLAGGAQLDGLVEKSFDMFMSVDFQKMFPASAGEKNAPANAGKTGSTSG